MARTGGACFLFGGLLVALLTALAPLSFSNIALQYGNATVAGVVGVWALLWDERLRLWQLHAMIPHRYDPDHRVGRRSANPTIAVSFATLYVFIACSAFFVAWPAAAAQLSVAIVCCLAAFAVTSTAPWWTGLVASGTTAQSES